MRFPRKLEMRSAAIWLALFLGAHAIWVLVPELIRPGIGQDGKFPATVDDANRNSLRLASDLASWIGFIRGDLWAERASVDSDKIFTDQEGSSRTLSSQDIESIRAASENALALRPLDSRTWLILANLSASAKRPKRAIEHLKMAYYTGPNDVPEISYRLKSVTNAQALEDPDLREAVRREIRTILRRVPELRPAILAAYGKAQSKDREFIETIVADADPGYLPTLKATPQQ